MDAKHLPGRHPIEKFGDGGFRFGGMSHRGSLMVLPSGMSALQASSLETLDPKSLQGLATEKDDIDFLLIGTGEHMQRLPQHLQAWLSSQNLRADIASTGAAVSTYNILLAENRRVAAVLIAVA